jgi:hypothetical protein
VDFLHHAAVKLGIGLVDTWCIDKDNLCGGPGDTIFGLAARRRLDDALDTVARGLRLVCHDGQLLAEQRIQ